MSELWYMTVAIWSGPERPRFAQRELVEMPPVDGEPPCFCAQGWVLHYSGASVQTILNLSQDDADLEVARLLGISQAESRLLRHENDSTPGLPELVLIDPASLLGPSGAEILALWRHADTVDVSAPVGVTRRATALVKYRERALWTQERWSQLMSARQSTSDDGAILSRLRACCHSHELLEACIELHVDGEPGPACRALRPDQSS